MIIASGIPVLGCNIQFVFFLSMSIENPCHGLIKFFRVYSWIFFIVQPCCNSSVEQASLPTYHLLRKYKIWFCTVLYALRKKQRNVTLKILTCVMLCTVEFPIKQPLSRRKWNKQISMSLWSQHSLLDVAYLFIEFYINSNSDATKIWLVTQCIRFTCSSIRHHSSNPYCSHNTTT